MPTSDVKLGAWVLVFAVLLACGLRAVVQRGRNERSRALERAALVVEGGARVLRLFDVATR